MITTVCHTCGGPKDPANWGDNECPTCTARRQELQEYVIKENHRIEEENKTRETNKLEPLPYFDMSAVIRQGMQSRGAFPMASHVDPRTGFVPGRVDPRFNNLGMGAHIPPNVTPATPEVDK